MLDVQRAVSKQGSFYKIVYSVWELRGNRNGTKVYVKIKFTEYFFLEKVLETLYRMQCVIVVDNRNTH